MHKTFLVFLILCLCQGLFAQREGDRIYWKADVQPGWTDFKAAAPGSNAFDAQTHWALEYLTNLEKDTLVFTIKCYFEMKKSWVQKDKKNDYLLNHERKHFDLGEVYTRKLRKALANHKFTIGNIQKDVPRIYSETMEECIKVQMQYDKETSHSKVAGKQAEWDKKIDAMLKKLAPYHKRVMKVPLSR